MEIVELVTANWAYVGMTLSFVGGIVSFFANVVTIVTVNRQRRKREKRTETKSKAEQAKTEKSEAATPSQHDLSKSGTPTIRFPTDDELIRYYDYHMRWRSEQERATRNPPKAQYERRISAASKVPSRSIPLWRRTKIWATAFIIFFCAAVLMV